VANQMVLTICYDTENISKEKRSGEYQGEVKADFYGRLVPKHAHGSANLSGYTSSSREIISEVLSLYDRIVNPDLTVRRIYVVANHVLPEQDAPKEEEAETGRQLDLFSDFTEEGKAEQEQKEKEAEERRREKNMQKAILDIQKKYGKNALLKGMNLEEGATSMERNRQVGGHKA